MASEAALPVAAQVTFERSARLARIPYEQEIIGPRVFYRVGIDVPVYDDRRNATCVFTPGLPNDPRVYIDGPRCLRHRWADDALCMWLNTDPPADRWMFSDGLAELVAQIKTHAYCEAECRAGRPWLKPEAPGRHRRPATCPTCHGRGRGR